MYTSGSVAHSAAVAKEASCIWQLKKAQYKLVSDDTV